MLYLYEEKSDFRELVEINLPFFQEHLTQTKIISLPDGTHDLQIQKSVEIAKLILNFLE